MNVTNEKYLCKAKRTNNGKWVEGYYVEMPVGSIWGTIVAGDDEIVCEDTQGYIIELSTRQHPNFSPAFPFQVFESEQYEIDMATCCRYAGIRDKNGKLIFENDILMCHGNPKELVKVAFGKFAVINAETLENIDEVIGWHYEVIPTDALSKCEPFCLSMPLTEEYVKTCEFEVGGSVFDNPELLEVQELEER